jgi:hypothetical protein
MLNDDIMQNPDSPDAIALRKACMRDALWLINNSNVIAHLQIVETILRRALSLVANARLFELRRGFALSTPHVVIAQTLSEAAFKKAYDDGIPNAQQVNSDILRTVLPSLDLIGTEFDKLLAAGTEINELYEAFCRVDNSSTSELEAVQRGTDSDTVKEA